MLISFSSPLFSSLLLSLCLSPLCTRYPIPPRKLAKTGRTYELYDELNIQESWKALGTRDRGTGRAKTGRAQSGEREDEDHGDHDDVPTAARGVGLAPPDSGSPRG